MSVLGLRITGVQVNSRHRRAIRMKKAWKLHRKPLKSDSPKPKVIPWRHPFVRHLPCVYSSRGPSHVHAKKHAPAGLRDAQGI